jgi:hypothetical protein
LATPAGWNPNGLSSKTSLAVSVVAATMVSDVAVIVVDPAATDAARPRLFMVATASFAEIQVTDEVISLVVPSEYVPVAENCQVSPRAIAESAGVTLREVSTAGVTVRVVAADTLPDVAWIEVVPALTDVARPLESMAAIPGCDEVQVTSVVMSFVELSV